MHFLNTYLHSYYVSDTSRCGESELSNRDDVSVLNAHGRGIERHNEAKSESSGRKGGLS